LKRAMAVILVAAQLTGCATLGSPDRQVLIGAGLGGAVGAGGGAVLSPNSESRGLNALVFGLVGTLLGGLIGYLSAPKHEHSDEPAPLQVKEQPTSTEIIVPPAPELPAFVRERLKPTVIESYIQNDTISEDGSLHEPHRVYRIKQPSELIARPIQVQKNEKEGAVQ
jgi:hypothetical protein